MPPPASSPLKQWENAFGATPCEESCEMTDIGCCPNPKIPSTALSDFVKSPVCEVLHLFHDPPSEAMTSKLKLPNKRISTSFAFNFTHDISPEDNRSWSICGHWTPKNLVKMHQVWYIIAGCPTAISILEGVCALIILTRTGSIRWLNSEIAYLVRTRDQWSCWRAPGIKGIELNLWEKTSICVENYRVYCSYCRREATGLNYVKGRIWQRKRCTWSPLDTGQPLQELQLTHRTSLPVSICT